MLHPRARTMLLLAIPALIIGVASSMVLIVVMKVASVLQTMLWTSLPAKLGISFDSPAWIILMLTLTGIAVGLVIRFSPGHAGPDPAQEPLIGAPVTPSALPGLIIALILGLAGGVSLGPEHPIMAVNIGLAVFLGSRIFPRVGALDWTILASAGTIGALFGTPVAAALIFSQTLSGNSDVPLWDRLFAPLMAAAAGALTTSLFFHPHFSLSLPHYGQMQIADIFSGAIVVAIAIALGMVAVWCLPRLHRLIHRLKHPVLILGAGVADAPVAVADVVDAHVPARRGAVDSRRDEAAVADTEVAAAEVVEPDGALADVAEADVVIRGARVVQVGGVLQGGVTVAGPDVVRAEVTEADVVVAAAGGAGTGVAVPEVAVADISVADVAGADVADAEVEARLDRVLADR